MKTELSFNSKESLDRPAWMPEDLHAYKHLHDMRGNVIKNYFVRSGGKMTGERNR